MTMPWGKFRGRDLEDLPSSYLVWVVEESRIDAVYKDEIRTILAERLALAVVPVTPPGPPPELFTMFQQLRVTGYRTLARTVHPDIGGSDPQMQQLNAVREWTRRQGWMT